VQPGKYLVDESGQVRRWSDAGIGGRMTKTASGTPIQKFNPPQPRLFATLIEGIMSRELPWGLVILGAVLAVVMQLAGVSALAFAVGVYLPLATTLPIFVGGVLRGLVDRARRFTPEEAETSPGTLMSTGLIAGGSLAGIIIALLVVFEDFGKKIDFSIRTPGGEPSYHIPAISAFAVMAAILLAVGLFGKRPVEGTPETGEEARIGEIV
jgi:OPT oligopeptide transporter protein